MPPCHRLSPSPSPFNRIYRLFLSLATMAFFYYLCNFSLPSNSAKPISKNRSFAMQAHRPQSETQDQWMHEEYSEQKTRPAYERAYDQSHSVPSVQAAVATSRQDLMEYICAGPLLHKIGMNRAMVAATMDKWVAYGEHLSRLFHFNEMNLSAPQKGRLYHYYIPVFLWCESQISQHRSAFREGAEIPPLVIGFSAPQGCGKSTIVLALDYLFDVTNRKVATVSIDDFYLSAEDQARLREANPGNALLELRGNAGSHDLQRSYETLAGLTTLTRAGMWMRVPRYDKSAYGGKGDIGHQSTWPVVEGPLQAVLFEGWMLGFKPVSKETIRAVDPQLELVNKNMEAYHSAWHSFIESWIVIKIDDPGYVYKWRMQAEVAMKNEGYRGMSNAEVTDFVSRYMPAYKAYLPTLYRDGPSGSDSKRTLVIEIDEARNPIISS